MPMIKAKVTIEDMLETLGLEAVPASCSLKPHERVRLDVEATQGEIDDFATERDPELAPIGEGDLRDGLRAVLVGDLIMGRTLLLRAFDTDVAKHAAACRVVEEELR